jgi:phosphonate transport system ATP-binding protein
MTAITLAGASAGYRGRTVLSEISLTIEPGTRVALVGESGVGKTTLINLLYSQCGSAAAIVPQDLGLVSALPVFHNVYMGQLHRRSLLHNVRTLVWPAKRDVDTVRQVLEPLRLDAQLFSPAGELSGGQQQRTAIARALFHPGTVLFGDEPVSAVDDLQAREILQIVAHQKQTVVVALHDRALAIEFADRIVGLRDGRIVMDESTDTLQPGDIDHLYAA